MATPLAGGGAAEACTAGRVGAKRRLWADHRSVGNPLSAVVPVRPATGRLKLGAGNIIHKIAQRIDCVLGPSIKAGALRR